jgi:hypothetical protein
MDVKVPYGEKDGRSFHVDEVENGIKCGCTCPGCGKKLIAANRGEKRVHHFKHEKGAGYATCLESSLHLAAKDILLETKQITLPAAEYEFPGKQSSFLLAEAQMLTLDDVILEKREGDITPDVIAVANGVRIFIEIFVTHKVDEDKLDKIREMGVLAVEVDLSEYDRDFDREILRKAICERGEDKRWLYDHRVTEFRERVARLCDTREYRAGWSKLEVEYCPIHEKDEFSLGGKPLDECKDCPHCFWVYERSKSLQWGEVKCTHSLEGDYLRKFMLWEKGNLFGEEEVR